MSEVTRAEFNGLGTRVDEGREEFVECRSQKTEKLKTLDREQKESKTAMGVLAATANKNNALLESLPGKLVASVAGLLIALEVINRVLERFGF